MLLAISLYRWSVCSIFLLTLLTTNCNSSNKTSSQIDTIVTQNDSTQSSREQLREQIYERRAVTLVYPADLPEYQQIAEQIAASSRWLTINLKTTKELSVEELEDDIFYVIGTPESNPLLAQLLNDLPIEITQNNIKLGEQIYESKDLVIALSVYPNPKNKQLPISIVTAQTDEIIIESSAVNNSDGGWSINRGFGYEIYKNRQRIVMGDFNKNDWSVKEPTFDFTNNNELIIETPHFKFVNKNSELDSIEIVELAIEKEAQLAKLQQFLKVNKPLPKLEYQLFPTAETKGLLLGNTERAQLDFTKNIVHVVENDIYKNNDHGEENIWFLRQWLGEAKTTALERGLALHFTDRWQRKGYHYWSVRLFTSKNLPKLATLLDNKKFADGSDLVLHGSAATFVDYLILEWEEAGFLKKYNDWQPTTDELQKLEKGWHKYLENLVLNYQDNKKRQPAMPFCKGFNFAHEGYSIYNGYGSTLATQSLEKMADMGVNSIAIVPYSYQRDPKKAAPIPLVQHAGNENDEAVVHSVYMARQLGQTTMLKPQIWLGRGEWPGSIEMSQSEEWEQWMAHYHDWILHFAMLAEIHEMELFCIGVEFVKATTQNPELWRQLIAQIRGVYSGYLTYAANWGEEFQTVNFWDDLDYIGLNSYYPLSKSENPTKKELMEGFAEVEKTILKVTQKYNKPLLFTETGFRSIEAPWQQPHAEANGANFNEMHQKMGYEVIYESTKDKDWCSGIYWWKFPTYVDHQGRENTGFTPNNKATEQVIRQYWKE